MSAIIIWPMKHDIKVIVCSEGVCVTRELSEYCNSSNYVYVYVYSSKNVVCIYIYIYIYIYICMWRSLCDERDCKMCMVLCLNAEIKSQESLQNMYGFVCQSWNKQPRELAGFWWMCVPDCDCQPLRLRPHRFKPCNITCVCIHIYIYIYRERERYITLHYITLHYITLHYIAWCNVYIYIYIYTHICIYEPQCEIWN